MSAMAWTKVDDKLPDDDTLVLVALNDDDVWPAFREGGRWLYVSAMPITGERVTHWMHLPPAPGASS